MSDREPILERIREALRLKAPVPGDHHAPSEVPHRPPQPGTVSPKHWLPKVGESFEERLESFRKNAADLKADFHPLNSRCELCKLLVQLRETESWQTVGMHSGDLTDFAVKCLGLPVCRTDQGYEVASLEACSVGITECDALVAQTGSVVITARSAGGRALSVLPPHHVVLARRDQLVADLPEAFALLKQRYGSNYPSFISFITGPSRTGDIERILVLGAHGPRRLTICCLEDA
jgi:L-lactate dehydrogenase complex protein LldG